MKNLAIYCDFDGTITTSDNIIAIMKHFAPPGWETIRDQIMSQEISVQQGVAGLFALLPSAKKLDIIDYTLEQAQIRPGFSDFVSFTQQNELKLNIVSGGIDFFVYPILDEFISRANIYCNSADFSGETINILWPHPCDEPCTNGCGCCKTSIMRKLDEPGDFKVVIGDSITDLEAAKQANFVLACDDFLIEKCRELNIPFKSFDTFFDCIDTLHYLNGVVNK